MRHPRQLALRLGLATSAVWTLGVVLLGILAVSAQQRQLADAGALHLRAVGLAVYGLSYVEPDGRYNTELLLRETALIDDPTDLVVASPEAVLWANPPVSDQGPWTTWSAEVIAADAEALRTGPGTQTLALPTYDDADRPVATVFVRRSTAEDTRALQALRTRVVLGGALWIFLGIGLGVGLARWLLRTLQAEVDAREAWLAAAAHELRTPLATLGATLDAHPDHPATTPLRHTVDRTAGMVAQLLSWSRLGDHRLSTEPTRLDLLVDALLHDGESLTGDQPVVHVDPELFSAAIATLLDNARSHGQGIDRVHIDGTTVSITDRGPGIPDDDSLWAPFRKGPNSRGTGLGLALAERIVTLHRGTIETRGSTVSVTLPH